MKQSASPVLIVVAVVAILAILAGGYWLTMGGGSSAAKTADKWSKPVSLPGGASGNQGLVMPQVPPAPNGVGPPAVPGAPGGAITPQVPAPPKGP